MHVSAPVFNLKVAIHYNKHFSCEHFFFKQSNKTRVDLKKCQKEVEPNVKKAHLKDQKKQKEDGHIYTVRELKYNAGVSDLHEESSDQCSADIEVIISAAKLSASPRQVEALHDPGQLLPHVVS